MQIKTVTELVQMLFNAYECNFKGLDWEAKINEYSDVIQDVIGFDTDLKELYKKIRLEYKFKKMPTPYDIRNILKGCKRTTEFKHQAEHKDNGKVLAVACFKDDKVVRIWDFVCGQGEGTTEFGKIQRELSDKYDRIKVFEFRKNTTIIGDIAFVPLSYDADGNVLECKQEQIA